MSTLRKHRYLFSVLFVTVIGSLQSHALTAQDEGRIIDKAKRARAAVVRYESMLDSLERKLEMALDEEKIAKTTLDRAMENEGALAIHDVDIAEETLDFASKKVNKLVKKIVPVREKLQEAKVEAKAADWKEKKVRSQRRYEHVGKRLQRARKQFEYHTRRVGEVEVDERETRAEAAAKNRLAAIGHSEWERKINAWQAQGAEKRADTLLGELKYYRDKVKELGGEIRELEKEFAVVEKDFSQYQDAPSELE